ncbi:MAG: hypothetical protein JWM57_740 [Phycisphaerales bacterium]|nr:hypothetical protein [Phycisphaerales bacterium]
MRHWICLTALIALAGCQHQTYTTRAEVESEPLTVDAAMQQRQWEPTRAYYENGDTRSWTTGFGYSPSNVPPYAYSATDTGTFLLNLVTLPYTVVDQWKGVQSGGVKLPPSYTANPPLPPSTQPTP